MTDHHRNPFEGVTDYFSELSRMRSIGTHGTSERPPETTERTHASAWVPTTDILAVGPDLVIRMELSGVHPDDVDLRFAHGSLTVAGVRRSPEESADYLVHERFYGAFRRTVSLPASTQESDITARFDRGIVEVTVRGAASPGPGASIALDDVSAEATTRGVTS